MNYLYLKSLHIIFLVTWFSGLFYMVRLMIYTRESLDKKPEEKEVLVPQFLLMQKRLWYIITWPGGILASIFGFWMTGLNSALLLKPWFQIKLFCVLLLWLYHWFCGKIYQRQKKGIFRESSFHLRLWNEIPTVLLFVIVFLAVVKSEAMLWKIIAGGLLIGFLIYGIIKGYRRYRENPDSNIRKGD